jgi:hypothetical protein
MNEVLQWAAIVILGVLAFGMLRQIGMWLPVEARSNTESGPPLGHRVPSTRWSEVSRTLALSESVEQGFVAFVSESCVQCQRLIAELETKRPDLPLAFVTRTPSREFVNALRETGMPVLEDNGDLWRAWHVTGTPLVAKVNRQGRVIAKGVTHRVDTVAVSRP